MVNNQKILEAISKTETDLIELKEKRNKLDEKIKVKEKTIEQYKSNLTQLKFSEAQNVFTAKGVTIDEILTAVKNGDFSALQKRIVTGDSATADD